MGIQQSTAAEKFAGFFDDSKFRQDKTSIFVLAWFLGIFGSFLTFLNFHEYDFFSAEVFIALTILVLISVLFAIVHANSARAAPLLDAALVFLVADLNFNSPVPAIAATSVFLISLGFRRSLAGPLSIIFLFVVGGQLVSLIASARADVVAPAAQSSSQKPAIIHIVLDEHIGFEALASQDPAIAKAGDSLRRRYQDLGFVVYGGAHSAHFRTTNSLPEILNFGVNEFGTASKKEVPAHIEENSYFDYLEDKGYILNVYQSDFVDFCPHDAVATCEVYRRNDLAPLADADFPSEDKTAIILAAFASLSEGVAEASRVYDILVRRGREEGLELPVLRLEMVRLTSTLAALDAADEFSETLETAKPGNVYFAHLLFPHYPYVTRSDCSIKPSEDWLYRRHGGDMASRNRAYVEQLGCAARMVGEFKAAVASSPAGKNAIFIIHGDHGSRITKEDPGLEAMGRFDGADVLNSYSTMLAIKTSGSRQGSYEDEVVSVSGVLKRFSENDLKELPKATEDIPGTGKIYLEDDEWRPRVRSEYKSQNSRWI